MARQGKTAEMRTGAYISGAGHAGLFLWVLIGGLFVARDEFAEIGSTDVSIISAEEFAALQPQPPQVVDVVPDAPIAPEQPSPEPVAVPETTPEPEVAPDQTTPDAPVAPDAPAAPEIAPEVAPAPQAAPRVAPEAAPAPEEDVKPDIVEQAPTAPAPEPNPVQESQEETAPEEAATEIVTEAEEKPSVAPTKSNRPSARPARPQATQVATDEPTKDPIADSIAAAVSEANETPKPATPSGPPLTSGERDGLRLAIQRCWNVGSLSSDALRVTVIVGMSLDRAGKPDTGSIKMISADGGQGAAVNQAYEAARRALIRCGAKGYDLPSDKFAQWQDVEITFNPERMRIK